MQHKILTTDKQIGKKTSARTFQNSQHHSGQTLEQVQSNEHIKVFNRNF